MNNGNAFSVNDNADFERVASLRRSDKHDHFRIVRFEGLPVMSNGVEHIFIGDSVFVGRRFDVHGLQMCA